MTTYYVRPTIGNDTNGGTSWASDSWATLKKATDTVAAGDNQIVMDTANADVITTDTTYTVAAGVQIVSSANGTSYTAGATVSSTTTGVDVKITGACAWHGVNITLGDGSDSNSFNIGIGDGTQLRFENCAFTFGGTTTINVFRSGYATAGVNIRSVFQSCSWTWADASQLFRVYAHTDFINCDFSAGATNPSVLFTLGAYQVYVNIVGCDLSDIATVFAPSADTVLHATISQCKLKTSFTSIYSPSAHAQGDVYLYDCDDGDSHIELAHYNYYGSTTISTSIYTADNIGDANLSWKVEGTANASKATPYWSPWLDVYHTGTSAITPYLEVLRSGSTTSYLESEAWIDVLAKTTASSTLATLYTNRASPLDTTTDNTDSSKGAGDWTGEDASNNWYGKLILNASITPAEAGHIRARVGLAGQYTLYVDPQVRGLA